MKRRIKLWWWNRRLSSRFREYQRILDEISGGNIAVFASGRYNHVIDQVDEAIKRCRELGDTKETNETKESSD
jgi:hypothetical protein